MNFEGEVGYGGNEWIKLLGLPSVLKYRILVAMLEVATLELKVSLARVDL